MSDDDESAQNESVSDDEEDITHNASLTDINNPWFDPDAQPKSKRMGNQSEDGIESSLFPTLKPVVVGDKEDVNVESDSSDSEDDDDDDAIMSGKGLTKSDIDAIVEKKLKETGRTNNDNDDDDEWAELDDEELITEGLERRQTLEKLNENWESDDDEGDKVVSKRTTKVDSLVEEVSEKEKETEKKHEHIDPNKVFTIQPKDMKSLAPNLLDDEEMTEAEEQRMNIQQAFADDDVVDEFQEEKVKKIDEETPKDIDLTLPGWGDWGGHGVNPLPKKQK